MAPRDLLLLLRLNKSWHPGMPAGELYEVTRAWWVMSRTNAARVDRVLAVGDGVVREVFNPHRWTQSPEPGLENRIGFEGEVAIDRERWLGRDLSGFFRQGSANPVRYLSIDTTLEDPTVGQSPAEPSRASPSGIASEPHLAELVQPLATAFEGDLLWAQSRAAQELFHSNTIAWLLKHHPTSCGHLLDALGNHTYGTTDSVNTERELHDLDIVIDPNTTPRIVVENKLYSVPYPAQLVQYLEKDLPWSYGHGSAGAPNTRYVLLSLLQPSFVLPTPWHLVGYSQLASALERIESSSLGNDAELFRRYVILVRRLVAFADAVDPAQTLDEPFIVRPEEAAMFRKAGLDGAIARMRFSGLTELVRSRVAAHGAFEVGGARGGIITYETRLAATRRIGWQFQDSQLRYFVKIEDDGLKGKGLHELRAAVVGSDYLSFFDHSDVAAVLGDMLRPYDKVGWLRFDPDFVYRHRPVDKGVSTDALVEALVVMTKRVDEFAVSLAASLGRPNGV